MLDNVLKISVILTRLKAWGLSLFRLLQKTIAQYNRARAADAAAGLAYYSLLSLFPLLLVLVAVTSSFFSGEEAYQRAVEFVATAFPLSRELIERNLRMVLSLRGPVGLVGAVFSLWSATLMFSMLAHNINLAWPTAKPRNIIKMRFVGLVIVAVLVVFFLLSILSTTFTNLLPKTGIPFLDDYVINGSFWGGLSRHFLPWVITFLMFLGLYQWAPNTPVTWRAAFWGALFAAAGWQSSKVLFAWYLNSGLVRYELVYGSLGAVVVFLFWVYLSGVITLFGAHLCAVIDNNHRS